MWNRPGLLIGSQRRKVAKSDSADYSSTVPIAETTIMRPTIRCENPMNETSPADDRRRDDITDVALEGVQANA